jgi:putative spermidine/putrescine transport system ATP-binding protein
MILALLLYGFLQNSLAMTVTMLRDSPAAVGCTTLPIPKLVAQGISKQYGTITALQPTDLEIARGELLTVLGPSGSGKTTLLQVICGLVEPTAGRLLIDGADQTHTPVHQRRMGVVFQNYALFPHLTVQENVAFPLDIRRIPAADLARRVTDTLEMVGLGGLRARFPRELSGGQQQRVALARCFVYEPSLILMDEPLGALDRKLRETMQIEIKRLHRQTGATIIFVTHDQDEALALSDRICLMDRARVEQIGTPQDIYERPATLFAADFIGISNVLRGKIGASGRTLVTADGEFPVDTGQPGTGAAFVIRPEHMDVQPASPAQPGGLRGTVVESVYAGAETRLMVELPSGAIVTIRRSPALRPLALGEAVVVGWSAQHARVLPV